MSEEPKSLCEAHGIPFERRCELALEALNRGWRDLLAIIEDDHAELRERELRRHGAQAPLSDAAKNIYREIFEEERQHANESLSNFYAVTWKSMIDVLRPIHGSDAVDFALATFKRERQTN